MADLSVGIIIIGDEILKGQVIDNNSSFLCKQFYSLGVKIGKISVIQDSIDEIASEVREMKSKYSYIMTTGGVGPTHDDVTYEGVAKALGVDLMLSKEMLAYYRSYCGGYTADIKKNPQLRIANIPVSSEIIFIPTVDNEVFSSWHGYPVVKLENIFILPGIPDLVKLCFKEIKNLFFKDEFSEFYNRDLYIRFDEVMIVTSLNKAVEKFKGCVIFGSYPILNNEYYQTKLTLESKRESDVAEAEEFLRSVIPEHYIVDPVFINAGEGVYNLINSTTVDDAFTDAVRSAVKIVEETFSKFAPETLFVNFNGGKDCTVLLHLVIAVWMKKYCGSSKICTVYFRHHNPFQELETFIEAAERRYQLEIIRSRSPIKEGLTELLTRFPTWKGGFLGTRRTDPCGKNSDYFQMTDEDWPQIMRVNPILNWSYNDVWTFLRVLNVPYCSLYDQGYTSLGSKSNTKPNPRLSYQDTDGVIKYHPAYMLDDESAEREGRLKKP